MIPKIFHQIFISTPHSPNFLKIYKKYIKKLKKLHPHWEYRYWDNSALHSFVHTQYPAFSGYFSPTIPPVIQSDIGRYLLLQYYGGWYLDLDYEFLRPIDIWSDKKNIVLPLSREIAPHTHGPTHIFGNAIIGSMPQQNVWNIILNSLPPPEFFSPNIEPRSVFESTGPAKITHIYNTLSTQEKSTILIPPKIHFHYAIPQMMSFFDYRKIKKNKDIFGIHHTYSSWIDKDLQRNVLRRKFSRNIFIRPFFLWYHHLLKTRKQ